MRPAIVALCGLFVLSCGVTPPEPYEPAWPTLSCDDIAPSYCGFPFPNNVFTRPDPSTPTGLRVALDGDSIAGGGFDTSAWEHSDGFAAVGPLLVHLPGARTTGLTPSSDIGASLDVDSRTLVIDTSTGEVVPHWVELDASTDESGERTLLLHPAARLRDGTRYVVALRGVVDAFGSELPRSPAMQSFVDGEGPDERQAHYDHLFDVLSLAGWSRQEVQIAWDFTTASAANTFGWLESMRDQALARVGDDGPEFTIDSIEDDWNPDHIARRVRGTFSAPLFLDSPGPGGRLLLEAGVPVVNAQTPTVDVGFEILVPNSALAGPKPLLQYGHGLFGEADQIESGHFRSWIDEAGWVFFAADLDGMAHDDEDWVRQRLLAGELDQLPGMTDRLHQGFVQWVLLLELMKTGIAEHPDLGAFVDPSITRYHGISQGGIMGLVYAALSPDIDRAALGVMGQPYALLLNRSVDFAEFFLALQLQLEDARDIQLLLGLVQMLWNRVEPGGWSAKIDDEQILLRAAIGDHQVPTLGAHAMARSIGAVHVDTGLRDVWGLPSAASVDSGHAYVEYDFGLPEVPACNVPMSLCDDPHGKLRSLDAARAQLDAFLKTGAVTNTCGGGVCSFPELSGCDADEDDAAAQELCGG